MKKSCCVALILLILLTGGLTLFPGRASAQPQEEDQAVEAKWYNPRTWLPAAWDWLMDKIDSEIAEGIAVTLDYFGPWLFETYDPTGVTWRGTKQVTEQIEPSGLRRAAELEMTRAVGAEEAGLSPAFKASGQVIPNLVWDVRTITNAILVLIALLGIIILVSADHLGINALPFKILIPRLVMGALLVNLSLFVCSLLIQLNNGLVQGATANLDHVVIFKQLGFPLAVGSDIFGPGSVVLFKIVIYLIILVLICALYLFYIFRFVAICLLIVLSPIVFALWILPQTQGFVKAWGAAFIGVTFTQFLHVLIIRMFASFSGLIPGLSGVFFSIVILYLMLKAPTFLLQAGMLYGASSTAWGHAKKSWGWTKEAGRLKGGLSGSGTKVVKK